MPKLMMPCFAMLEATFIDTMNVCEARPNVWCRFPAESVRLLFKRGLKEEATGL